MNFKEGIVYVFTLFTFPLLVILPSQAKSETCDFHYLAQKIPLLSDQSIDLTEKTLTSKDAHEIMLKVLPNVKMVFGSREPKFLALLGWSELSENYETLSRFQVETRLHQMAELGKQKNQKADSEIQTRISEDYPVTLYLAINYIDNGEPYRDIGVDIIATPRCLVSLKVSAKTQNLNSKQWATVDEQFENVRIAILSTHGPIAYNPTGTRFSKSNLLNRGIFIGISTIIGAAFFVLFRLKYIINPNQVTRKYSVFIILITSSMIILTIVVNEFNLEYRYYDYENIWHFIILLLLHSWSYKTKLGNVVLIAISAIIGGLTTNISYYLFGWMAIQPLQWVGLAIGFVAVSYTLLRGASKKTPIGSNILPLQ